MRLFLPVHVSPRFSARLTAALPLVLRRLPHPHPHHIYPQVSLSRSSLYTLSLSYGPRALSLFSTRDFGGGSGLRLALSPARRLARVWIGARELSDGRDGLEAGNGRAEAGNGRSGYVCVDQGCAGGAGGAASRGTAHSAAAVSVPLWVAVRRAGSGEGGTGPAVDSATAWRQPEYALEVSWDGSIVFRALLPEWEGAVSSGWAWALGGALEVGPTTAAAATTPAAQLVPTLSSIALRAGAAFGSAEVGFGVAVNGQDFEPAGVAGFGGGLAGFGPVGVGPAGSGVLQSGAQSGGISKISQAELRLSGRPTFVFGAPRVAAVSPRAAPAGASVVLTGSPLAFGGRIHGGEYRVVIWCSRIVV